MPNFYTFLEYTVCQYATCLGNGDTVYQLIYYFLITILLQQECHMNFNSMEVFNLELKDVTCAQYWPVGHCVWDGSQHQPSHSLQSAFLHECTAPGEKPYRYAEDGKAFKYDSDFYTSICDNDESIGWFLGYLI